MFVIIAALCFVQDPAPAPNGVTLSGVVQTELGEPIKNAMVYISTAAPKVGLGYMCPSCYRDCGKHTFTDEQGKFSLKDLAADLRFSLLAVAEGFVPAASPKSVDPSSGPTSFQLKANDLDKRDPNLVIRGKVVDSDNKPVPFAQIEPFGQRTKRSVRFGSVPADKMACSNSQGEFRIGVDEKDAAILFRIKAKSYAPLTTEPLKAGNETHLVQMNAGVTVTGKVVKDGKPIPKIGVGLVQTNRSAEGFTGPHTIETDSNGAFQFVNVPGDESYFVYGIMDSCRKLGAIGARDIKVGPHGSTKDIGALALQPGLRLTGTVLLPNGKPVPESTPVVASRDGAWDLRKVNTDSNGNFEFDGLPQETLALGVVLAKHMIAADTPGIERFNPMEIKLRLTEDITGYKIRLVPASQDRWNQAMRPSRGGQTSVVFQEPTPLAEGVRLFNEMTKSQGAGLGQTPLTEDEIVASIRWWGSKTPGDESFRKIYENIAETRMLPAKSNLGYRTSFGSKEYWVEAWQIVLQIDLPAKEGESKQRGSIYVHQIRFQHVRSGTVSVASRKRMDGEEKRRMDLEETRTKATIEKWKKEKAKKAQ